MAITFEDKALMITGLHLAILDCQEKEKNIRCKNALRILQESKFNLVIENQLVSCEAGKYRFRLSDKLKELRAKDFMGVTLNGEYYKTWVREMVDALLPNLVTVYSKHIEKELSFLIYELRIRDEYFREFLNDSGIRKIEINPNDLTMIDFHVKGRNFFDFEKIVATAKLRKLYLKFDLKNEN